MSDKRLTPYQIKNVIKERGDVKLSDLIEIVKKDKVHECPKCKGAGFHCMVKNVYPSGLPDSGWVEDMQEVYVDCDLCEGFGYTKKKMRPTSGSASYTEAQHSVGDIFLIEEKEYVLKLINDHWVCWLAPVLLEHEGWVFTGGLEEVYHIDDLENFEKV